MGVFPSLPSLLLLSVIPGTSLACQTPSTFLCLATPIAGPLDFLQVPDLRFQLSFEHLRLTANKHGSVLMSLEPNSLPAPPHQCLLLCPRPSERHRPPAWKSKPESRLSFFLLRAVLSGPLSLVLLLSRALILLQGTSCSLSGFPSRLWGP